MKPFFSYYGAKHTSAKHYGPPRSSLVIEPFAGSACYSTRWSAPFVKLYDKSEAICVLWDFLIKCSSDDITKIPDRFEDESELLALPEPERILCGFWVSKGRAEPSKTLSPWYFQYRNTTDCRVWGPAVKQRILSQKPNIRYWTIQRCSWENIPFETAHWHVDPPYNNTAGSRYPHSDIDYQKLASWCRALPGEVDVCENDGADWLPFRSSHEIVSSRGRRDGSRSAEAIWRKTSASVLTNDNEGVFS